MTKKEGGKTESVAHTLASRKDLCCLCVGANLVRSMIVTLSIQLNLNCCAAMPIWHPADTCVGANLVRSMTVTLSIQLNLKCCAAMPAWHPADTYRESTSIAGQPLTVP